MEYVNLGPSGLKVSRLCLGCMSYGDTSRGWHGDWVLDQDQSRPFIREAMEAGINFFDTANMYSLGASEEVVGKLLPEFAKRDEIVLATKAFMPWRQAPNAGGLSRKALMQAIDDSLTRLNMDYVDLFQIHRWDKDTPIEETMEALHDIVKAGKARYIGASSMWAWQFAKAQEVAKANGWTRFISMQNHVNLLSARKSARCCRYARIRASGSSHGARWRAASLRAAGTRPPYAAKRTGSAKRSIASRRKLTAPSWRPWVQLQRSAVSLARRWRWPGISPRA